MHRTTNRSYSPPAVNTGPRVGVKHDGNGGAVVRVLETGEAPVFGLVNRASDPSASAIRAAAEMVAARFTGRTGATLRVQV